MRQGLSMDLKMKNRWKIPSKVVLLLLAQYTEQLSRSYYGLHDNDPIEGLNVLIHGML
jgi:hypothetical protein